MRKALRWLRGWVRAGLGPGDERRRQLTVEGVEAIDSLDYNRVETADRFYRKDSCVEAYLDPARQRMYRELLARLPEHGVELNGRKVLDLGCGPGGLLEQLDTRFEPAVLWGVDLSSEAVRQARKRVARAHVELADLFQGLPDGAPSFDVILCLEVLEHLEAPAPALSRMLSWLGENGTLVLTVPDGRRDTFAGHTHFWSPESWRLFCEDQLAAHTDSRSYGALCPDRHVPFNLLVARVARFRSP